ncbi:uncharacterized protein LOC121389703 [Gigantopelta aegis]|uniref:uncharacterized protein LOC121389703 n=1 Tax=Gigantopelta aegis TaxID=1735272 RepID=UPI001B8875F3|nr:uncharacterized protein LOC121389703 [Gigantopelta aegis]
MTSVTFDANYAPSLGMECSSGGALTLDASSFTDFSWVAELRISNCEISSLAANAFQNLNSLNLLLISGGSISNLSLDTLYVVNIQKDYTAPSPRGEFALLNVKTNGSLPQALFSNLVNVTSISIINCGITSLHASTFGSLAKLSKVTIDEEILTYLDADTFTVSNQGLGILVLNCINWNCTCRLWWMDILNLSSDTLYGVNIQKDYTAPSPRGEFALINVRTNGSLPQALFSNLINVMSISVINCGMTSLHANTFGSLAKLSKVTIDEQMLTYLDADTFTVSNQGLGVLVLNSINCYIGLILKLI